MHQKRVTQIQPKYEDVKYEIQTENIQLGGKEAVKSNGELTFAVSLAADARVFQSFPPLT